MSKFAKLPWARLRRELNPNTDGYESFIGHARIHDTRKRNRQNAVYFEFIGDTLVAAFISFLSVLLFGANITCLKPN